MAGASDMTALLERLGGDGWGAFDEAALAKAQKAELAAEAEEARAQAAIVATALEGEAGHRFLEWLIGKTLHRPPGPFEISATTAEMYALAKARREGQNQIVFMILAALATARGETIATTGDDT